MTLINFFRDNQSFQGWFSFCYYFNKSLKTQNLIFILLFASKFLLTPSSIQVKILREKSLRIEIIILSLLMSLFFESVSLILWTSNNFVEMSTALDSKSVISFSWSWSPVLKHTNVTKQFVNKIHYSFGIGNISKYKFEIFFR